MLRLFSLMLVSLLAGTSSPSARRPVESRPAARVPDPSVEDSATAIVNVTVVPMDRDRTLPGQTVLVEHGTITALGPVGNVPVPANARRIDGRGKFLIPGLSDMHLHLRATDGDTVRQWLLLLVANGVTTVRSMDYEPQGTGIAVEGSADMIELRAQVAAGDVLGPRIYTSGWWGDSAALALWQRGEDPKDPTAEQVEQKIAAYKARGYDFIKVRNETPTVYRMLAAAARKVGISIAGHVPDSVSLGEALAARQHSIEHLKGYAPTIRRHSVDGPKIITATKAAGVWNCPTVRIIEGLAGYFHGDTDDTLAWPEVKRYFSAKDSQRWKEEVLKRAATPPVVPFDSTRLPPDAAGMFGDMPGLAGSLAATRQFIKALQDSGAGLLTGTDLVYPEPPDYHGFALHRELQALVRAGLTPYQTLVASTRNAAEFFGTLDSAGTVAVGKRADLVLLNGNPLTDIRHTMLPAGVVVAGRWLSRADLDARLAEWRPTLPH